MSQYNRTNTSSPSSHHHTLSLSETNRLREKYKKRKQQATNCSSSSHASTTTTIHPKEVEEDNAAVSSVSSSTNPTNTLILINPNPLDELQQMCELLIAKNSNRSIVAKVAMWIAEHAKDPWTVYIQVKLRTWITSERMRNFNQKIMLLYVLHEFLKIPCASVNEKKARQRIWMETVEHIVHTCVREMHLKSGSSSSSSDENKKKLLKTLARWEELGIFVGKVREWKRVVVGDVKPRKVPPKILVSDSSSRKNGGESRATLTIDPFDKEGLNLHVSLNRLNLPCLVEDHSPPPPTNAHRQRVAKRKRHWRFTGAAFIDALGQCLGMQQHVVVTAMHFYHRVFERGIYAMERYKVAGACLFLAAKASSQRMRLLRMVHAMHYILETPLQTGTHARRNIYIYIYIDR